MKQIGKKLIEKKKILFSLVFLLLVVFGALKNFSSERIQYQEDVDAFFEGNVKECKAIGKPCFLSKGIYDVRISYVASSTNHSVSAGSYKNPKAVKCDAICLERGKEEETFTVWIQDQVDDFQIELNYLGVGDIKISEIVIEERTIGRVNQMFCDLLKMVLLAGMIFAALKWKSWRNILDWRVFICLVFIIVFSSLPLFTDQIYMGHDSDFHFRRIEGICQGLRSGQFPVRIQPNWLHGYGYAVSIMYGEALLYFPAVLRLLGFSLQTVYRVFAFGINIATVVVAYYCFKTMFRDKWIALTATILYTLSPYRMVDVYVRGAVGEFLAMLFFPLVILGFWSLLCEDKKKKKIWPFIVGFTGLLQSHMISSEMVAAFSALFCLIFIKQILKRENLVLLIKSAVSVVALNLWFLLPFLEYLFKDLLNINVGALNGWMIQNTGATFGDIMAPLVNPATKRVPMGIGLGLQVALIILCIVLVIYKENKRKRKIGVVLLGFSVLALWMSTCYWPYDWLVQRGFVFMGTVQFPWRFLAIAAVMLSMGGCFALTVIKGHREKTAHLFMALLIGGTIISSGYLLGTFMEYMEFAYWYEFRDEPYNVGGGEYLPADVIYNEGSFHPLEPQGEQIDIAAYEKKYNRITVTCQNLLDKENPVSAPILLYRGYRAYDKDTKEGFPMARMENGMTAIFLPAKYEGTLTMRFCEPILWRVAELVSFLMFCTLIFSKFYRGRINKQF